MPEWQGSSEAFLGALDSWVSSSEMFAYLCLRNCGMNLSLFCTAASFSLSTVITDFGREQRKEVGDILGTLLCAQHLNKYLY